MAAAVLAVVGVERNLALAEVDAGAVVSQPGRP